MEKTIEQEIESTGSVIMTAAGDSMRPLITPGNNILRIVRPSTRPKKYDVVLFKNKAGNYVLHRIIKCTGSGYIVRGDFSRSDDGVIKDEDIVGVLEAFARDTEKRKKGRVRWISANSLRFALYGRIVESLPCRMIIRAASAINLKARREV